MLRQERGSQILSAQEIDLLDKWCSQANDSTGYAVAEFDDLKGKPWDNPHFIKVLRREGEELELEVSWRTGYQTSGRVSSIQSVSEAKHAWGPCLKLSGPLVWTGTQQSPPNDFQKLFGFFFKSFAKPTVRPITFEYPHLMLIAQTVLS